MLVILREMALSGCLEKTFLNHFIYLKGPSREIKIGLSFECRRGSKGVGPGTHFSLAWLVAEENLSESGLALLIGSGFKKACVLLYTVCSTLLLNSRVVLLLTGTG